MVLAGDCTKGADQRVHCGPVRLRRDRADNSSSIKTEIAALVRHVVHDALVPFDVVDLGSIRQHREDDRVAVDAMVHVGRLWAAITTKCDQGSLAHARSEREPFGKIDRVHFHAKFTFA